MENTKQYYNLINKITKANEKYRIGEPIMSDSDYDILLDKFKNLYPEKYDEFRLTLFENVGKVKLPYIMGSLEKIKKDDIDELKKYISKHVNFSIFAMEKLDGMSCTIIFENGEILSSYTRGNGEYGEDITEKVKCMNNTFENIDKDFSGVVRGELILIGDDHIKLGYKNRRNGVVGLIGNDKIDKERLNHVVFVAYKIYDSDLSIAVMINTLSKANFYVPLVKVLTLNENNDYQIVNDELYNFYNDCKKKSNYDIDGIVISSLLYKPCDENNLKLPEQTVAFKSTMDSAITEVESITWETAKTGAVIPVVNIKPVNLCGVTISNATGYNAKYINDNKVHKGSKIEIKRSGDVIPYIVSVFN